MSCPYLLSNEEKQVVIRHQSVLSGQHSTIITDSAIRRNRQSTEYLMSSSTHSHYWLSNLEKQKGSRVSYHVNIQLSLLTQQSGEIGSQQSILISGHQPTLITDSAIWRSSNAILGKYPVDRSQHFEMLQQHFKMLRIGSQPWHIYILYFICQPVTAFKMLW